MLNKITVSNKYPIPQIDDLLDQLKGGKYFIKINLKSGYHQVPIKPFEVWKIAFKAKEGLFKWLVMPFGLTNAPTTFMRLIFMGLANFYYRFVLGFSHITWPLSQVTKGGTKEKLFWFESQQKAFTKLKHHLFSTPVLALPELQQPFEIETDASNYAIRSVLTQHGNPVEYHNETLSDTVWKYPTLLSG
eukprot:PITA_09511